MCASISFNFFRHFSSRFTLISAHTNFHNPRINPSGRKVIRYRRRKKEREKEEEEEKKTTNLVSTTFATQPVCNVARAAHALRSDQYIKCVEGVMMQWFLT